MGAKQSTETPVVAPNEVSEVQQLLEVEQEIMTLIQSNPGFYQQLQSLVQHRNELLVRADKTVREMKVTCGPFVKISESTKIDAEKLFEELGEEAFKDFGGYTETVVDYKVDRTRVLSHLASGQIPEEVAELCITTTPSYKAPKTYLLP